MKKALTLPLSLLIAASFSWSGLADSHAAIQEGKPQMPEYEGKVNAPEFPEGMEWLNTERPLTIPQLRGKLVLLDFWTYCCINCMHIIPDLKKLEHKYANELVVIGVHAAKFTAEKAPRTFARQSFDTRSNTRWSTITIWKSGRPTQPGAGQPFF